MTATTYDLASIAVVKGDDLFALALLTATLTDWLATCHATVPPVCSPGWSMPAVTMRLVMTKHDMRKGRKTGSPVSAQCQSAGGVREDECANTWVERRVDNLLGLP